MPKREPFLEGEKCPQNPQADYTKNLHKSQYVSTKVSTETRNTLQLQGFSKSSRGSTPLRVTNEHF